MFSIYGSFDQLCIPYKVRILNTNERHLCSQTRLMLFGPTTSGLYRNCKPGRYLMSVLILKIKSCSYDPPIVLLTEHCESYSNQFVRNGNHVTYLKWDNTNLIRQNMTDRSLARRGMSPYVPTWEAINYSLKAMARIKTKTNTMAHMLAIWNTAKVIWTHLIGNYMSSRGCSLWRLRPLKTTWIAYTTDQDV